MDELVKSQLNDGSIVGAPRQRRDFAPDFGHAQRAPALQGAQELRRETFYETIHIHLLSERLSSSHSITLFGSISSVPWLAGSRSGVKAGLGLGLPFCSPEIVFPRSSDGFACCRDSPFSRMGSEAGCLAEPGGAFGPIGSFFFWIPS
jgi:hypothetical protein